MSLVDNVSLLLGRGLNTEEMSSLANFQRVNQIDDSDPLITVLALMARSHLIMETLPKLLQEKATETITLHQQTLREQSTLIAKELVLTIAQDIRTASLATYTDWKTRWISYGVAFAAGSIATGIFILLVLRVTH